MTGSEYGASYTGIESFSEYRERLNFRLNKRNSEYAHQPFSWDSNSGSDFSAAGGPKDTIQVGENQCVRGGTPGDGQRPADDTNLGGADATEGVAHPSLLELKESSTQTHSLSSDSQQLPSRGTFGPYGIGSTDFSNMKGSSNLRSQSNVYPSAARTDARRRSRLAELHSGVGGQTETRHNRSDLTCPSKRTALPLTSNRAARSRDGQPCMHGGKCDVWLSEYNRQFPVYPTSVYTRSASVAAGRCRPLSGRPSSRNVQPSLVAAHPVLLSSRKVGAVVGTNQSNICSCNG
ncbi:hypothetical protein CRM22_004058 [Opisthorchis felineus]|uniref:Uncharacterized protein n=1 Tax=Opisthorchis felineus TaxID=147828 RepID=A0A4S2LY29_OPIFE|nr:hypothetical protein CRM22_004058 [Opisthorchis felineus]